MEIKYLPIIVISSVFAIYWYFTRTFKYWKKRNVVGPEPVALFGNIKDSTLRRKCIGEVLKEIYDQFPDQKVVGVYRMTTPCLLIRDLDIIKHVMIKDFDVFCDRGIEFSKEGLGANLFHADANTWRVLRTQFTPIFTSMKLKNMFHLMNNLGDNFLKYVESLEEGEHEIYQLMKRFTMSSIASCVFGLDFEKMQDQLPTLKKVDELVLKQSLFVELDMMYPGVLRKLNSSLFPAFVTDFFGNLVKKVVAERNNMPSERKDFMDILLELRKKGEIQNMKKTGSEDIKSTTVEITDGIIAAQAFVFYMAGYETTATTMTFFLYSLALNSELQDKLLLEIDDVVSKNNGELTYDVINNMVYLEQLFKETLRMHTVLEPLQRNANCDYKVPGTDIVIKKGMTVLVLPMGIHYDEKYYPNPEIFDPERFSPENSADRHPCAHMPFGIGPRNCIGYRFAKLQFRVGIVKFLSKYRVVPSKNTPNIIKYDPMRPVMGPVGGIHLNVIRRS
ncbi:hypothetical protein K1T71_009328 [Dendrolimus kikuchii]|uniref:Uncharacterized protein n=1 Tax=Dendrolimus kikuchii TaxID=765133 RepID=A0ACC1CUC6_9NEOP|nr:hypothetical protein K1T71_009328 [Dendrolimus kikuchii]